MFYVLLNCCLSAVVLSSEWCQLSAGRVVSVVLIKADLTQGTLQISPTDLAWPPGAADCFPSVSLSPPVPPGQWGRWVGDEEVRGEGGLSGLVRAEGQGGGWVCCLLLRDKCDVLQSTVCQAGKFQTVTSEMQNRFCQNSCPVADQPCEKIKDQNMIHETLLQSVVSSIFLIVWQSYIILALQKWVRNYPASLSDALRKIGHNATIWEVHYKVNNNSYSQ